MDVAEIIPGFPIQLADVEAAERRIRPFLPPTPLYEATSLSAHLGRPVFAKLESMNPTGAFKVRGAFNFLLSLTPEQQALGVVAASVLANELEIACAGLVVGHKYSTPEIKNDDDMQSMSDSLESSKGAMETLVLKFLENARPVAFANRIYRFSHD